MISVRFLTRCDRTGYLRESHNREIAMESAALCLGDGRYALLQGVNMCVERGGPPWGSDQQPERLYVTAARMVYQTAQADDPIVDCVIASQHTPDFVRMRRLLRLTSRMQVTAAGGELTIVEDVCLTGEPG